MGNNCIWWPYCPNCKLISYILFFWLLFFALADCSRLVDGVLPLYVGCCFLFCFSTPPQKVNEERKLNNRNKNVFLEFKKQHDLLTAIISFMDAFGILMRIVVS